MAKPLLTAACFGFLMGVHALSACGQPVWGGLDARQKEALAPLEQDWDQMEPARRKKWLNMVNRHPEMTPEKRERFHSQVRDWDSLTPEQRKSARDRYRKIDRLPPERRHEIKQKWHKRKHQIPGTD